MHTPDVQARVPPVLVGQTTPQPPQLFTSLVVLTSQPSVRRLPLQSAKPALQVPVHALPEHTGVAMLFDEQAIPQPPQLVELVVVLVSHPLVLLPSQLPKPAAHTGEHTLATQLVELVPVVAHTVPHAPQLLALVVVLTHTPEQLVGVVPLHPQTPPAPQVPPVGEVQA